MGLAISEAHLPSEPWGQLHIYGQMLLASPTPKNL